MCPSQLSTGRVYHYYPGESALPSMTSQDHGVIFTEESWDLQPSSVRKPEVFLNRHLGRKESGAQQGVWMREPRSGEIRPGIFVCRGLSAVAAVSSPIGVDSWQRCQDRRGSRLGEWRGSSRRRYRIRERRRGGISLQANFLFSCEGRRGQMKGDARKGFLGRGVCFGPMVPSRSQNRLVLLQ